MADKVSVIIGKRTYLIDKAAQWGELFAVVSYPKKANRVLIFRAQMQGAYGANIFVFGGQLSGERVIENSQIANALYIIIADGEALNVSHFIVLEKFRHLKIGSLLRELIIEQAKEILKPRGKVVFPFHRERKFYVERGFHEEVGPLGQMWFAATIPELKARQPRLEFQVFWKRENS